MHKLWDVVSAGQTDESQELREPSLIGRVVAVDEEDAMQLAKARYLLKDGAFCVCQI